MDVGAEEPDPPPPNYRVVNLVEPPMPGAGDLLAPVGELGLSADPARCGCRCDGVISLANTGESVACEAVCCLPRNHDGGIHACARHDLARLAQARRG
eukprot:6466724-Alexandrium_andersonii.AAC.1